MSDGRNPAGSVTRGVEAQVGPDPVTGEVPHAMMVEAAPALTARMLHPLTLDADARLRVDNGGSTPSTSNPTGISPTAALAISGQLEPAAAGLRLTGFTYRETAGATASFRLHHGTANTDPVIAWVGVPANTGSGGLGAGGDYGGEEVLVPNGVYLDVLTGAVEVIGFVKVVT